MAWGSALRGAGAFCGRSVVLNQCLLVVARLDQCAYPPKTSRAAAHSPTQNNRGSVISGGCSRRSLTSIEQLMIHSRAGKGLMRRVAGGAAAHAVGRPPGAPWALLRRLQGQISRLNWRFHTQGEVSGCPAALGTGCQVGTWSARGLVGSQLWRIHCPINVHRCENLRCSRLERLVGDHLSGMRACRTAAQIRAWLALVTGHRYLIRAHLPPAPQPGRWHQRRHRMARQALAATARPSPSLHRPSLHPSL